jgi:GTPase
MTEPTDPAQTPDGREPSVRPRAPEPAGAPAPRVSPDPPEPPTATAASTSANFPASAPTPANNDSYEAAIEAVRQTITRFDGCSDQERTELQHDLDELERMSSKLTSGRVEIVVFGEISTGKSALINAIVGDQRTHVNVQGGWTKDVWNVPWETAGYSVPGFADSQVVLIDTPGLNEVDGRQRADMARAAAARADLILFVTDSDLNDIEHEALATLASSHKPIILVLNKADLYRPEELDGLLQVLHGPRYVGADGGGLIEAHNIVVTQADPREVEYLIEAADGSTRSEWRKPLPEVDTLRQRIVELLGSEGKALVALNGVMFAADKSDRMAALRIQMREETAAATVWKYAVIKSLAVALNPGALLDVLGGTAVDAAMVVTLGRIYGIGITTAGARSLVTSILKAAGWVMLGEAAVSYASSIFKGLTLGYGTILTALPQGAAAGYGSTIVGQAARYYFQNGASWGDRSPKQVVSQILNQTDKGTVLERLKTEIKQKISLNPYVEKS